MPYHLIPQSCITSDAEISQSTDFPVTDRLTYQNVGHPLLYTTGEPACEAKEPYSVRKQSLIRNPLPALNLCAGPIEM